MMDGLVDVYRPEVHGVYETVDYAHYWNSIELVLVAHQEVFVGQSLHILQPILLLFIDLAHLWLVLFFFAGCFGLFDGPGCHQLGEEPLDAIEKGYVLSFGRRLEVL